MLAGKVATASSWIKDGAPVPGLHRLWGWAGVQVPGGHRDCGHPGRGAETRPGLRAQRKQDREREGEEKEDKTVDHGAEEAGAVVVCSSGGGGHSFFVTRRSEAAGCHFLDRAPQERVIYLQEPRIRRVSVIVPDII